MSHLPDLPQSTLYQLGSHYSDRCLTNTGMSMRRFTAFFGAKPRVCSFLWSQDLCIINQQRAAKAPTACPGISKTLRHRTWISNYFLYNWANITVLVTLFCEKFSKLNKVSKWNRIVCNILFPFYLIREQWRSVDIIWKLLRSCVITDGACIVLLYSSGWNWLSYWRADAI